MAKGIRSNRKKAVRSQRRLTLKATWQEEADARRYEALAKAIAADPVPSARVEPDEDRSRAKPEASEAMDTEGAGPAPSKKRKKKGVKVKGVVKKRHNGKQSSALWVSEFHKKKKGRQGLQ